MIPRVVLLTLPDLGFHHLGALEEICPMAPGMKDVTVAPVFFGSARHEGERIHEGFGAFVDVLIGALP